MPDDDEREKIRKAEREIAANLPDAMIGRDSEDVGDLKRAQRDERER